MVGGGVLACANHAAAFADAVAGHAPYPITPTEMLADIAALEAIGRSASTGTLVDVAPVDVGKLTTGAERQPG